MKIDVRLKGIKATDDIKDYLLKKLSKLDKFTTRELEAKCMLKTDAKEVRAEITIPVGPITIRSEESSKELFDAIDKAALKLEHQINNNRHKLVRNLSSKEGLKDLFKNDVEVNEMVNSAVKIKQFKLEVLTFDEAVTQLELLSHDFFLYKNDKGNTCCVYLRRDGEYGLIETF